MGPDLGGVEGELFEYSVGDDSSGAEVGDVGIDVADEGRCFIVWELLVRVCVSEVGGGSLQVVVLCLNYHLVPLVSLADDKRLVGGQRAEG